MIDRHGGATRDVLRFSDGQDNRGNRKNVPIEHVIGREGRRASTRDASVYIYGNIAECEISSDISQTGASLRLRAPFARTSLREAECLSVDDA